MSVSHYEDDEDESEDDNGFISTCLKMSSSGVGMFFYFNTA